MLSCIAAFILGTVSNATIDALPKLLTGGLKGEAGDLLQHDY
jgi:hypothetical protein